jgi:hypothetical protein
LLHLAPPVGTNWITGTFEKYRKFRETLFSRNPHPPQAGIPPYPYSIEYLLSLVSQLPVFRLFFSLIKPLENT